MHAIFSSAIFPLPLIQERQLLVTDGSMDTYLILVNRLGGLSLPKIVW